MITIVLPARNEALIIRANLARVCAFLDRDVHEPWQIIVAVNGSTDATATIVRATAAADPRIELLEVPGAGKGGAVIAGWTQAHSSSSHLSLPSPPSPRSGAEREGVGKKACDAFVFMDTDLATDLEVLPKLITGLRNGADIAVGSRYAPGAHVERSTARRFVSQCYRMLLRTLFHLRVTDAPCGCKAINARVLHDIVPTVRDTQWFFDTELLIRAQAAGMRIVEIPVTWHEPRKSGSFTKVPRIIAHDLQAMWRLWRELRARPQNSWSS